MDALRKYGDLLRFDDHEVLATEFGFNVPIAGTWDDDLGEEHRLAGTINRLAVRHFRGVPAVCTDDWKALWVNTALPTPTGWSTMSHVAVGEQLIGNHGRPCTVIRKSEAFADRGLPPGHS